MSRFNRIQGEWDFLKYDVVKKEVEGGDESAKTKLAWLMITGVGGCETDEEGAVDLLQERVDKGDSDAMWMLGTCYEFGRGIDQDVKQAEHLYELSSRKDNGFGSFFAAHIGGYRGEGDVIMHKHFVDRLGMILPLVPWSSLNLSGRAINRMHEKEGKMIGDCLAVNNTLTELFLGCNVIGDAGARAIAEALIANTTLTRLDLSDNSIGWSGAEMVGKSLLINTTLTELNLRHNDIKERGAKSLGEALVTNTSLVTLYLTENKLCFDGAIAICQSLMNNTTLTTLFLTSNQIGPQATGEICALLKKNATLTTLNLKDNSIGTEGEEKIRESLMFNTTLTKLDLGRIVRYNW